MSSALRVGSESKFSERASPPPGPTPTRETSRLTPRELTPRELVFGTPNNPPPPSKAPKSLDLRDIKLKDSLPSVFVVAVQAIQRYVLRFLAWLRGGCKPLAPEASLESERRGKSSISAQVFDDISKLKQDLSNEFLINLVESNTCFAPEMLTEIFRAMGQGDVEEGRAFFKANPLAIFLYLMETQWRAAWWGSIERFINVVKDKIVTRELDPKHAEICVERFCNAVEKRTEVDVVTLIETLGAIRLGISAQALRQNLVSQSVNDELAKGHGTCAAAFARDPFCILLLFDGTSAERAFHLINGKNPLFTPRTLPAAAD